MEDLKISLVDKKLLGVKKLYNREALFFYIIDYNETFYFGVEEFDFKLEGYQIRLVHDIEETKIIDNFSSKINEKEGLIEKIKPYKINLESFETIFNDLYKMDKIISIEREYHDDDNFFLIGKIVSVTFDSIWFKDFSVDGIWNEEISIIPFELITTVRFDSNYINIWEKYIWD